MAEADDLQMVTTGDLIGATVRITNYDYANERGTITEIEGKNGTVTYTIEVALPPDDRRERVIHLEEPFFDVIALATHATLTYAGPGSAADGLVAALTHSANAELDDLLVNKAASLPPAPVAFWHQHIDQNSWVELVEGDLPDGEPGPQVHVVVAVGEEQHRTVMNVDGASNASNALSLAVLHAVEYRRARAAKGLDG